MGKTRREDFMGDSGGFLDGVRGVVIDAKFEIASGAYADKMAADNETAGATTEAKKPPVVLTLTVESDELEKPATQSWSVGGQDIWDIQEGGKVIVNKKNPDKHIFRNGSNAYDLIEGMALAIGSKGKPFANGDDYGAVIEEGQKLFGERDFYVTESGFYLGFDFTWAQETIEKTIGKTVRSIRVNIPKIYHGVADKTAASAPVKVANKQVKTGPVDEEEAILDKLLMDNATGKTEKQLKSWAVKQDAIKANDAYMKKITSGEKTAQLAAAGKLILDDSDGTYL